MFTVEKTKDGFYKVQVKIKVDGAIKYLSHYSKVLQCNEYILDRLKKHCLKLTGKELETVIDDNHAATR